MLRALSNCRLFGSRTRGSSGYLKTVVLAPDWSCQLSTRQLADHECRLIEGRGIEPDELVAPTVQSASAGHDPVLERARQWIRE